MNRASINHQCAVLNNRKVYKPDATDDEWVISPLLNIGHIVSVITSYDVLDCVHCTIQTQFRDMPAMPIVTSRVWSQLTLNLFVWCFSML